MTIIFYSFIGSDNISVNNVENSIAWSFKIIFNNLKHFLLYILAFILYPVYIITDIIGISYQMALGLRTNGFIYVLKRMILHSVIEIPNCIIYSYLSLQLFKGFIDLVKSKGNVFKFYKNFIVNNYIILILNIILIIVSGIIEGLFS